MKHYYDAPIFYIGEFAAEHGFAATGEYSEGGAGGYDPGHTNDNGDY